MTQILLAPVSEGTAILCRASNTLVPTACTLTLNPLRSGNAFDVGTLKEGLGHQKAYGQGATFLLASKPFQSRHSYNASQYLLVAALSGETTGLMLNVYA